MKYGFSLILTLILFVESKYISQPSLRDWHVFLHLYPALKRRATLTASLRDARKRRIESIIPDISIFVTKGPEKENFG
jgi:hypothetical protein